MRFNPPIRRPLRENVLPMINIVFLLLIFFLMTAQIAPPDPVDITLPDSAATDPLPDQARPAWLGADGVLRVQEATGADALARLADRPGPVTLRADADLPAAALARLLAEMHAAGIVEVNLVTIAEGGP